MLSTRLTFMNNDFPLLVQKHKRSRHLKLKFCPYRRHFIMTAPPHVKEREIERFLTQHRLWMQEQAGRHKQKRPLQGNDRLSILGDSYVVMQDALLRPGVWEREGALVVGGGVQSSQELRQRLLPWLKKRAYLFFLDKSGDYANELGVAFKRVSIRDTVSRWGSCSMRGTLSFNWRLILAPPQVAEYVCVHEVCHLREMNHSQAFWGLVEGLAPDFQESRLWLKRHGAELYSQFPLQDD